MRQILALALVVLASAAVAVPLKWGEHNAKRPAWAPRFDHNAAMKQMRQWAARWAAPGMWRKGIAVCLRMINAAKQTAQNFREKYRLWLRIRLQCPDGNCPEYFEATKNMILAAIDATLARLENIEDINVSALIDTLEEYKEQVASATSIEELRAIYPEIRDTIRTANQVFSKTAFLTLINVYKGAVEELRDVYPEEVEEILSELEELENNIYTLENREIALKLRTIRAKILALRG